MLQIKNTLGGGKPEGLYAWKKLSAQGGDFIDYVVSDKETAYPDGGEKGGYWYERVSDGITPEMFGCTKMAVDTFTLSSRKQCDSYPISHSLGTIPKFAFVIAETFPTANYDVYLCMGANLNLGVDMTSVPLYYWYNGDMHDTSFGIYPIDSNTITLNSYSYYFTAGVKYTLVTMA